MLIQITNRCRMGCPHCLDDSRPDGGLMYPVVFKAAVHFARESGELHLLLSGGEPSEHPLLFEFCRIVSGYGFRFSLATNGMWMGDEKSEYRMERIANLPGFVGAQIYSNPKWYRLHEETVSKYTSALSRWKPLGFHLDLAEIRGMLNLGRAKSCPAAMAEAESNPYHNSCLASCVTLAQSASPRHFCNLMIRQGRFCTPMIDWQGKVHMSESCLCPSVGKSVLDPVPEVWEAMRAFRPCGGCLGCKRYLTEQTPKMVAARRLLGQQRIEE